MHSEFRSDCRVWINFLESGTSAVCRPFVDLEEVLQADILNFYTDAAKREDLGFGGMFNKHWLYSQWEPNFIQIFDPSIEYMELFGVCCAVFAWSKDLANRRVQVHCDNQSVVTMINKTTSSCKQCMILIRLLTLHSLKYNMRIFTRWVRGRINSEADTLSRLKLGKFRQLTKNKAMDKMPTPLPSELWQVSKFWINPDSCFVSPQFMFVSGRTKSSKVKGSRSSNSSSILTSAMEEIVIQLKQNRHRDSTKRNYYCVWKSFNDFFIRLDIKPSC